MTFTPFTAGERHVPNYYRANVPAGADPIDIAVAYELGPALAWALKYLLRAGKKPGEPEIKDLHKAMEMIQRRVSEIEGR